MTSPRSFRFVIHQMQTLLFIHSACSAKARRPEKHASSLASTFPFYTSGSIIHNSPVRDVSLIWFNVLSYAWVLNGVLPPSFHSGWIEQTNRKWMTNEDVSKTLCHWHTPGFQIHTHTHTLWKAAVTKAISSTYTLSLSLIIREVSKQNWEETERSIQIIPEQTGADSLNCSICLPKIGQFILISAK